MSLWSRPSRGQTDAEKQAAWANQSRLIGEGQWAGASSGPGLIQRIVGAFRGEEQRAITSLPWNVGSPLPSPQSAPSPDVALALGAVYAATSLIARTIAGLPLHAYRDVKGQKTELDSLPSLFDEPSVQGDLFDWLHRCLTSMLMYGNAYGLVTNRDGFGYPTGIEWLSPEHITVVDFAFTGPGSFLDPVWRWRGRVIPKENMVHIPWYTLPWRVLGLSPLQAYAASVNTGLGAQKFSTDWFNNGGVPPGTFKNAVKTVPREEAKEIKARLTESMRTHEAIVYGADWDYNPIAINPQEAQFIQTMKLTATQVAVIYGVPPDRIGGEKSSSLTYSTVEQDSIDFVQFTILNYARKLESAFFKILPTRQYVRFDLDALIRVDSLTRRKIYQIDRQIGLRNIDEIRNKENLPPLPNGEGKDYAPLLATGLAVDPEDQAAMSSNGNGTSDTLQVIKAKPRQPYKDTGSASENNSMRAWFDPDPQPVNVTVNVPEREVHYHAGDVTVQASPPADVRIEQPITVNTPEVQLQPADVRIDAPVTVNTPEVQVAPTEVNIEPAIVNVSMPVMESTTQVAESKSKQEEP